MPSRIDGLVAHIAQLEREVEHELNRAREQWRYRVDAGRIRFDRDVHLAHKRLKQSIPRFIRESSPLNIVTAPIIYSMVVPIALIDVSFSIYQILCFPLYGISHVRRSVYVVAVDARAPCPLSRVRRLRRRRGIPPAIADAAGEIEE
jgi:hypothetical protein